MRVGVLCGSRAGRDEQLLGEVRRLGRQLAQHDVAVAYGGARIGLMGAIADGALDAGGHVSGIVPRPLVGLGLVHPGLTDLSVVDDLAAQQSSLLALADVLLVLPGGLGTMYEAFMACTGAQLGLHQTPVVIANLSGAHDALVALLAAQVAQGFVHRDDLRLVHVLCSVDAIVASLVRLRDQDPAEPLLRSVLANAHRSDEVRAAVDAEATAPAATEVIRFGGCAPRRDRGGSGVPERRHLVVARSQPKGRRA